MAKTGIIARSVTTDGEFHEAIELQAKMHAFGGFVDYHRMANRDARLWPSLKRESVRVAVLNGKVVASFRILPLPIRIGCVTVPMGGISAVCTHPQHRKKGYMAALMRDGIEHMRQEGVLVSMLTGIADFYHRFGYAYIGCNYKLKVQTRVLNGFKKRLSVRAARTSDLPRLKRLYERTYGERTCTVVRDDRIWRRAFQTIKPVRVIFDRSGELKGYFSPAPFREALTMTEVCVENSEQVLQTLLAESGRLARSKLAAEVHFRVPPDHPLAIYCRGYDAVMEISYSRNSGWMMRIVNLEGLFSALEPEFSERLKRSPCAAWRGAFEISTDTGSVTVTVSDRIVRCSSKSSRQTREIVKLAPSALTQLLVGYRSGEEQATDIVPPGLRGIVAALFPAAYPVICRGDWF